MKIRWDNAYKLSKRTAECSCSLNGGGGCWWFSFWCSFLPICTWEPKSYLEDPLFPLLPRKEPTRKYKKAFWNPQHSGKVIVGGLSWSFQSMIPPSAWYMARDAPSFFFIFLFIWFIYLAALGFRCCERAFSGCGERGLSSCGLWALEHRLSSCGARA